MLTTVVRLWYNTVMDEHEKINQDKINEDNSNVPAPIADETSDELMLVPDGDLPTDNLTASPAEPASVTMFDAEQGEESLRGGYASVKGPTVDKHENRLVWIVILFMTVMCIAVGICSAVITARLVQKGIKPAQIITNGEVQQNISAVVTTRKTSIVEVKCEDRLGGVLTASGIVMKRSGKRAIVLTNAHAIEGYESNHAIIPRVRFYGYDVYFADVVVVGYDEHYDVAVLSVAVDDELVISDIDDVDSDVVSPDVQFIEGDYVVSIGNAMSMGIAAYDGTISRKSELLECNELFGSSAKKIVPVFRTTAVINAGMSGGGVFDMKGRLIGLGTYRMSNTAGVDTEGGSKTDVEDTGFATPMSIVYPVYKRILSQADGGQVGLFTVNVGKTTSAIGRMDMPMLDIACEYEGFKLTVKTVSDSSSKIKKGDVITKIGNYAVTQAIDGINVTSDICGVAGQLLRYHVDGLGKPLTVTVERKSENGVSTLTVTFDRLKYAV